ncbi:MAG: SPOR domain-containing protein [Prevotellaceae bacterium]|jgi:cell division septation protein DedD|nr:SPOR domain-containing protein [Prevotellaceae bacterium]
MYGFEKILQQAVLNNRRVIIPNLGAFINNSSDRTIVFSSLLKTDDGFLEKELRSYGIGNAPEMLQNFVRNALSAMENKRRFNISGLGYLYQESNNIQFVPEIDLEKHNEAIAPLPLNYLQKRRRHRIGSAIATAGISCIMLGTFTYYLFGITDAAMPLEPLISKVETPEKQFTIAESAPEVRTAAEVKTAATTTTTKATTKATTTTKATATGVSEVKVRAVSAEYAGNSLSYHVIAGCFEDRMNAERFVVHCKREGYPNAAIIAKLGNLTPVTIGSFSSREEASAFKREYNDRYMESAWVYSAKKR